jgi:outer membrane lipoprotein-sorting protein
LSFLRRIPLNRLLLLCGVVLGVGIGATALASALGAGPTPKPEPLAQAIHDGLVAPAPEGVSANIQLTNQLLEGAGLASEAGDGGGEGGSSITSSPLFTGGSGRLWASGDGRFRLELQDQSGDTQVIYDGHTLEVYDAASNTLYRYTPPKGEAGEESGARGSSAYHDAKQHEVPSVKQIEEAISHLQQHASVSGAEPADVAGQPAYTVRVGPKEPGSLFAGAELSFDADNGTPLRTALYSTASSSPVLELAATEISYGPVPDSVFSITPPPNVKVEEVKLPSTDTAHKATATPHHGHSPKVTTDGRGPGTIVVLRSRSKASGKNSGGLEGLPQVNIDGTKANELRTALGTLLSFERSGVRYLLAGSVSPAQLEAVARGL